MQFSKQTECGMFPGVDIPRNQGERPGLVTQHLPGLAPMGVSLPPRRRLRNPPLKTESSHSPACDLPELAMC